VTIDTRDGRRLESARITLERGSPEVPLSTEQLWAKFSDCLAIGNPKLPARAVFEALMSLERQPNVAALCGLSKAA
jgi:hypothetical protein